MKQCRGAGTACRAPMSKQVSKRRITPSCIRASRNGCGTLTQDVVGLSEEGGGFGEEEVEGVVVQPVAGGGDGYEATIADAFVAGIVFGNREETFFAPEK